MPSDAEEATQNVDGFSVRKANGAIRCLLAAVIRSAEYRCAILKSTLLVQGQVNR